MIDPKPSASRILIIEDEPLLALNLRDLLVDAGFAVVGMVGKLERALAIIESGSCDAAIVDANLAGVSAAPAGAALLSRNVPYIVMSGYSRDQLQGGFPGARYMQKPCRASHIIAALKDTLHIF